MMLRLILAALLMLTVTAESAEQLVIIANVPNGGAFDGQYALSLVRGENKNWDGGGDALVVLPSRESALHEPVASRIFSSSGRSMQRRWFQLVFSGRVNAPKYLSTDMDVVKFVMDHEGAVGIVTTNISSLDGLSAAVLSP